MAKLGIHLIVDAWQAPAKLLNDPDHIRKALLAGITAGEVTLIDLCIHQFCPQGVTATATLAESHIAIHTWPEHGYFAVDLFFCGQGKPEKALQILKTSLQAEQMKVQEIERGFPEVQPTNHLSHLTK
ncbi:MAG TPA: adenosylmethionine decarboxylase [Cyanothece sp. UBA12306]|nr:adenosylmethionine decarboxylase [Cyanothece sp. UBA12306]